MRWGVIGYGSIGKRHSETIISLGDEVIALTKNKDCTHKTVSSVQELLSQSVDSIVVCNETSLHLETYEAIRSINPSIPLLMEKPLFQDQCPTLHDDKTFVAYCLRFHPVIKKINELISGQKRLAANFYCGQYLPSWRPERDYRETYSAQKNLGGGVLRDLSHEIDLAQFLIGDLSLNFSFNSKVSALEIDTDDIFIGHFKTSGCKSVTIELNYLDRITQRAFTIITEDHTYKADLVNGTIITDGKSETVVLQKNEMFLNMFKAFKGRDYADFCDVETGLHIVKLFNQIQSIEG